MSDPTDPLRGDPESPEVRSVRACARLLSDSIPVPAHECPDVTTLLIELARLHGVSEAAERTNHGRPPIPPPTPRHPVGGRIPLPKEHHHGNKD